jgi:serine/threonine-protein kinase
MNEREVFEAARNIHEADARQEYLRQVCGGDAEAISRLNALLHNAESNDAFLRLPDTNGLLRPSVVEQVGSVIGPYKLLQQIGEGGFGVVYQAEQFEPIRRLVAIKVIKPGMDSRQVIARFEAERQALAILDHPHIAKVFDAGTTPTGRPFFVMELVNGIPITHYCDQHRLNVPDRLRLFVSVCQAIQHAHSKGLIHRDIKPGNVLVARYDDCPVPKIIDFGVAKAAGQPLTEHTLHTEFGAIIGSLEYMSPEQATFNQLDIDTRSDVYALGVLLYELLTGSPPIQSQKLRQGGLLECLRLIREFEPPRPSFQLNTAETLPNLAATRATDPGRLAATIRGDLDWIVMKALEKDRNQRYETASGLADEVSRFLAGEPVRAHPPSMGYGVRKFVRRHPTGVALSLLATALVAIAAIVAVWQLRTRAETRLQNSARLNSVVDDASQMLGAAIASPVGRETEWAVARAAADRVEDLIAVQPVEPAASHRAGQFLADFREAAADRTLAEQIESFVIMSATHEDLESWQRMAEQFRSLFAQQGIDLDKLAPAEIGRRIREHRSAEKLCDALELYIGTLGQISSLRGPQATAATMQPLADAMYAADPDPVRTNIRRLIYSGKIPDVDQVDAIVDNVPLDSLTPRTLSWLATVYYMAGSPSKADDVFHQAVAWHPANFMLNFDFAYVLAAQKRPAEAIRYYVRCVAIRPDVAGIWRALGNAYRDNQEYERSREALQRSIAISPDHKATYLDLGKTYLALSDFAAAEGALQTATEAKRPSAETYYLLGRSLHEQQRLAEAIVALERCLQLLKTDPAAAGDLAQSAEELLHECKKSLNDSPDAAARRRLHDSRSSGLQNQMLSSPKRVSNLSSQSFIARSTEPPN